MSSFQDTIIASIPSHLRQFVVHQHYNEYTPQDHAVWRYVMSRNLSYLSRVAHPAYLDGLEKTGISLDYIPDIDDMNRRLGKIGWKAVVVDGFVPPAAFMEFQAHKILVISAEIRNIKNILYTPAPDIIHEAAGHAPIIADESYSDYLQKIGEYGARSVFSRLDYEIYEAIRQLSIIKEYPDATADEIARAEKELEEKIAANTVPSESAYLARLHWWTVEYGLIGTPEEFKIYGAGILSSVGESKDCMNPRVKKIPLSIETSRVDYDITKMQPQLFVARSFDHLLEVLEEFANTMCFRRGGEYAVASVKASENVGTVILNTGLQISGIIERYQFDENGRLLFLKMSGPVSLAVNDKELPGHGTAYHSDGFSSPLGSVKPFNIPIHQLSADELEHSGFKTGNRTTIEFISGYTVKGVVENLTYNENQLILISFSDCTVTDTSGTVIFRPEWGTFDMAVGSTVTSAFSGSADKEKFNVYPPKSDRKAIKVTYTEAQKRLFGLYETIDSWRSGRSEFQMDAACQIAETLSSDFPDAWLVRLELLKQLNRHPINPAAATSIQTLHQELSQIGAANNELQELIQAGLNLIADSGQPI
jgi:phenylalanine-4-hydroxylase